MKGGKEGGREIRMEEGRKNGGEREEWNKRRMKVKKKGRKR